MKQLILPVAALLLGVCPAYAGANVYASALSSKDGKISFVLNDDAEMITLNVMKGGETIESIELGAGVKGLNTVDMPEFTVIPGSYSWSLTASAAAITEPVQLTEAETTGNKDLWVPGKGIAIDCNPANATFGNLYVSVPVNNNGVVGTYSTGGVYVYNSALEIQNGNNPYTGNQTWIGQSSLFSLAVADDGKVFIADWSDTHSGVYVMNPADPATFTSVFASNPDSRTSGLVKVGDVAVHGSVQDIALYGNGSNQMLYTQDEDYTTGYNDILRYNIGNLDSEWDTAPTNNWGYGKLFKGANNIRICSDRRGGLWVSQRTDDNRNSLEREDAPTLQHINSEGVWDYQTGDATIIQCSSEFPAMAANADGTLLAITQRPQNAPITKNIIVCSVEFDESDKPSLTKLYEVSYDDYGQRVFNMAFDAVDNLYLVFNNNNNLGGIAEWALPKEKNEFTTPANDELVVEAASGVIDAAVSDCSFTGGVVRAAAGAAIYTVAGVKVAEGTEISTEPLAAGVYVVRAGSEIIKIVK